MVVKRVKDRHAEGVCSISALAAVYGVEIIDRHPVEKGNGRLAVDAITQFCDQNGAPVQGSTGQLRQVVSMRDRGEIGAEHLAARIRAYQLTEDSGSQQPALSSV